MIEQQTKSMDNSRIIIRHDEQLPHFILQVQKSYFKLPLSTQNRKRIQFKCVQSEGFTRLQHCGLCENSHYAQKITKKTWNDDTNGTYYDSFHLFSKQILKMIAFVTKSSRATKWTME